ncbi:ABC transporter ATP-binding protein, partial [Streptomyces viridochromogenes]
MSGAAAGAITLDGMPLTDLSLEFLRENVALLPQETLILKGTVRENIACGRPGASDEDIERAARTAAAHDFIAALPEGYDTRIAPGTAALSGGQLKRITLARAMLRAAPVLVLDEPTAGLDSVAARQVVQPLRRLMSGRTTIMITHDLSLASDADRVLVVDGGRLVEAGTRTELVAR